jgi:MFS family permease
VRAALRVVGGTLLGTFAGMTMALPAAIVADSFFIPEDRFERGMGVFFAGLAGAGFGFWSGTAAGLTMALLLERYRSGRMGDRTLTLGAFSTALFWVLVALLYVTLNGVEPDYAAFLWIIAGMGLVWTILATAFVRARARAWKTNQNVGLPSGGNRGERPPRP